MIQLGLGFFELGSTFVMRIDTEDNDDRGGLGIPELEYYRAHITKGLEVFLSNLLGRFCLGKDWVERR